MTFLGDEGRPSSETSIDLFIPNMVAIFATEPPFSDTTVSGLPTQHPGLFFVPESWAAGATQDVPFNTLWTSLTRYLYRSLSTHTTRPLIHMQDGYLYSPAPKVEGAAEDDLCTLFGCSLGIIPTVDDAQTTATSLTITLTPAVRRFRWYQVPVTTDTMATLESGRIAVFSSSVREGSSCMGDSAVRGPYCPVDDDFLQAIEVPSLSSVGVLAAARDRPVFDPQSQSVVPGPPSSSSSTAWMLVSRAHTTDTYLDEDGDVDGNAALNQSLLPSSRLWRHTTVHHDWSEIPPKYHAAMEDYLNEVMGTVLNLTIPFRPLPATADPPLYFFHPSPLDVPDMAPFAPIQPPPPPPIWTNSLRSARCCSRSKA